MHIIQSAPTQIARRTSHNLYKNDCTWQFDLPGAQPPPVKSFGMLPINNCVSGAKNMESSSREEQIQTWLMLTCMDSRHLGTGYQTMELQAERAENPPPPPPLLAQLNTWSKTLVRAQRQTSPAQITSENVWN